MCAAWPAFRDLAGRCSDQYTRDHGRVPDIETAHLVATSAYAGFQWVIRVVVYPQLAEVSRADFPGYLDAYQRRVTYLVAPLFGALVVTTVLVVRSSGPYLGKVATVGLLAV